SRPHAIECPGTLSLPRNPRLVAKLGKAFGSRRTGSSRPGTGPFQGAEFAADLPPFRRPPRPGIGAAAPLPQANDGRLLKARPRAGRLKAHGRAGTGPAWHGREGSGR